MPVVPTRPARADLAALARPMPPLLFACVSLAVLFAGAAYCLGYERLRGGHAVWGPSLLWSAYGLWPWLLVLELVKRRDAARKAPLPLHRLLVILAGTAAVSLLLELLNDL